MRNKLRLVKRHYVAVGRKHVRNVQRLTRRPIFTIPFATFVVLTAIGVAGFMLINRNQTILTPDSKVVILDYYNQKHSIPTDDKTVGQLLRRLNIKLNYGDVVEPSLTAKITEDNFRINIYRGIPVKIVEGNNQVYAFSAATTPRSIAAQAGVKVYPEDYLKLEPTTNFLTQGSIGENLVIDPATPINVNVFGTPTVIRTHAKTVGALLADEKIKLSNSDSVDPAPSTPLVANSAVFLIHKGTQIVTQQQAIPTPVESVDDSSLTSGTTAIEQQGSPGQELLTYQVNLQNGKPVSQQLIQTVVTQQPVTQIVKVGTAPLALLLQTWLYKLRMCESGGNYQENTGNSFYGAYQFTIGTWDKWNTGYARADLAPPQVQDATIIENTNASSGGLASQNPGCYYKEGLSAFPPAND